MSSTVHTVQLVYTSPHGYHEDRFYTVAAFTSEEQARLFVKWAEQHRKVLAPGNGFNSERSQRAENGGRP